MPYGGSVRLIPARAGNTGRGSRLRTTTGAHPRSRGEHGNELVGGGYQIGLIPARAGNTIFRQPSVAQDRAHPRSRGEHLM